LTEQFGMNPARVFAFFAPVLLALLFVVIANLPLSITGGLMPAPLLALAPIYFWVVLRPELLPPIAVLLIGLFEDLLSGGPPGIWAFGFLAAYGLADRQREVFEGLSGVGAVLGFAATVFTAAGAAFLLASFVYWRPAPLASLLLESLLTILFYPLLAIVLTWANRNLVTAFRGGD
jgi:rod shape-determining protein MreD